MAAKPGRAGQFDNILPLDDTGRRTQLSPLTPMPTDAQLVFDLVVRENGHLTQSDVPLVMGYALACMRVFNARGNTAEWERACRVMMAYATKLRVSPQACIDPVSLGRRRKDQPQGPAPWEYRDDDHGDENG
jgi:hypothetical protein